MVNPGAVGRDALAIEKSSATMPVWRRRSSRKIRAAFSRRGSGGDGSTSQKLVSIGICPETGWLSTDLGQGIRGSDSLASCFGPDLMVCSREKELRAMITSITNQDRTASPPIEDPSEAEYWKPPQAASRKPDSSREGSAGEQARRA